ncbi:hypothetical protein OKW42_006219 [Paraburkholderia sp. WC7.3d]
MPILAPVYNGHREPLTDKLKLAAPLTSTV